MASTVVMVVIRIGRKRRAAAEHFDWVQTVDREKILKRLSSQRPAHASPLNVCIQVNIDREPQKAGVLPEETAGLARACSELPGLRLRGLMAIPARDEKETRQRQAFAEVRQALERLKRTLPDLDTLSLGMSVDLEAAIAEGATILRPGTAIFGPRDR